MRHPLLSGFSLCLVLAIGGCQASLPPLPAWQSSEGRTHAELGTIVDLASEQVISPETLVERLADAPRVLVGEKHDNPDHHALQLWLLRALQGQRTQGSLLLEMLQPEQQSRMDKLAGQPLPEDLPKALAWQEGWDWQLYGPIVTEALQHRVTLLAANLSPAEMRQAYRQPAPVQGEKSNAPAVKAALLEQVRAGHCGMLPESQLPAMLAVQQQRDRHCCLPGLTMCARTWAYPCIWLTWGHRGRARYCCWLRWASESSLARLIMCGTRQRCRSRIIVRSCGADPEKAQAKKDPANCRVNNRD